MPLADITNGSTDSGRCRHGLVQIGLDGLELQIDQDGLPRIKVAPGVSSITWATDEFRCSMKHLEALAELGWRSQERAHRSVADAGPAEPPPMDGPDIAGGAGTGAAVFDCAECGFHMVDTSDDIEGFRDEVDEHERMHAEQDVPSEVPPAPSAPVVSVVLGTVRVLWDGRTVSGDVMPVTAGTIVVWCDGEPVGLIDENAPLVLTNLADGVEHSIHLMSESPTGRCSASSKLTTVRVPRLVEDSREQANSQPPTDQRSQTPGSAGREIGVPGLPVLDGATIWGIVWPNRTVTRAAELLAMAAEVADRWQSVYEEGAAPELGEVLVSVLEKVGAMVGRFPGVNPSVGGAGVDCEPEGSVS